MRIAQVPPLYERVPPRAYGGTERVVHFLVEELVRRGHEVTLFGTGDAITAARLISVCPHPIQFDHALVDPTAYNVLQLGMVYDRADEFDVIHSHAELRALPFARFVATPTVSTSHNRLDAPETQALAAAYPEALLTAISRDQRSRLPGARWLRTIHNGIPVEQFGFRPRPGGYLAFVGRMSPEKGPAEAIEIARRTGYPLLMAAKVNAYERDYFEQVIRPLLDATPHVEYLGELSDADKTGLLAGAVALLFPINWPEPFGLVMIEAMACGTPVVARANGAVSEIVLDGVTGFIYQTLDEAVARCADVVSLDRAACRRRVESCFSAAVMADGYEAAYHKAVTLATADEWPRGRQVNGGRGLARATGSKKLWRS
ncbi:MAG: glycosyltransferase family 4 protein [Chloroflexi bacterium]|nr:glycosyltransferase family 4 protein [Chloroflexota bacterium]